MAAAGGIVIGQRQVKAAVAIEIHEAHAVRRILFQDGIRQRLDETRAVDEQRIAIARLTGNEIGHV